MQSKIVESKKVKYRHKKEREIYATKELRKERKGDVFDQRLVKRKKGKYMRSKSDEKKEREIYSIKKS